MKLLTIAENKVTVELERDDLALLGLLCRETANTGLFGEVGRGACLRGQLRRLLRVGGHGFVGARAGARVVRGGRLHARRVPPRLPHGRRAGGVGERRRRRGPGAARPHKTRAEQSMKLVDIAGTTVTLALGPHDCLALGLACEAAAHIRGGGTLAPRTFSTFGIEDYDPPRFALYEALAAAFRAAMMAGAAGPSLGDRERERFTLDNVRREWGDVLRGEEAPPAA
jgi:hypothetical protein